MLPWRDQGRSEDTYPDVEIQVLVCYRLDVEAYCWYCCDYFANLLPVVSPRSASRWNMHTLSLYSSVVLPALSCIGNQRRVRLWPGLKLSHKPQNQYPYLLLCPYQLCER